MVIWSIQKLFIAALNHPLYYSLILMFIVDRSYKNQTWCSTVSCSIQHSTQHSTLVHWGYFLCDKVFKSVWTWSTRLLWTTKALWIIVKVSWWECLTGHKDLKFSASRKRRSQCDPIFTWAQVHYCQLPHLVIFWFSMHRSERSGAAEVVFMQIRWCGAILVLVSAWNYTCIYTCSWYHLSQTQFSFQFSKQFSWCEHRPL